MIKVTRAWLDSQGEFHQTREDACKAEFRRLLVAWSGDKPFTIDRVIDGMFDIDKMIGEATKEDTRVEFAGDVDQ